MLAYQKENDQIKVGCTSIPVMAEYDVVVVGGGMAGVGAALAAGKAGKKTILVENTSALGGWTDRSGAPALPSQAAPPTSSASVTAQDAGHTALPARLPSSLSDARTRRFGFAT